MIAEMIEGFVLAVYQLVVQAKNLKNGARNNSFYQKYWWDSNSKINSTENSHSYYRVTYDKWGRMLAVEDYDSEQTMKNSSVYRWKLNRVVQMDGYNEQGTLVRYQRPIYKYYGYVDKIEMYAPDGTLLEVITEPH